mmetsp:Transcript_23304/g.64659  ORF Transcript_23304/g.64659 Transcript_23304/m.64659 type:complete len:294 (+) Transcript_23304:339-1220(+)
MNKIALAALLISFASNAEPFSAVPSQNSAKRQSGRLLVSAKDQTGGDVPGPIDIEPSVGNDAATSENTSALSGLLDEMFEAKLETSREKKELESLSSHKADMPVLGNDGIYRIISQNQLENFKAAHSDKLVFLKFSSPICAACRMLKHKFQTLHRSPKFAGAPVVFADIVISNNKKVPDPFRDYVTSQLQVHRVPSIHFYAEGGDPNANQIYCDNDGGGCSWPKIQQQMLEFVERHYTASPPKSPTSSDLSSSTAVSTIACPTATALPTPIKTTGRMSKRDRIRRFLSLSWLR